MTFALVTFGCRVNQADSLAIGRSLSRAGGAVVPPAEAGVIVVNTCAVTASAEQDARQAIRRLARERPHARIVVTGCYARRDAAALAGLPGVTAVVDTPTAALHAWAEAPAPGVRAVEADDLPLPGPGFLDRTVATLSVQHGCSGTCSFCVVPSTRGPARSTPIASVLDQIRALADAGYHEVILAGVHLGSWGRDLAPRRCLADLLEAVARRPAGLRIRLSSLEPMDVTPAVEDLVAESSCFAPHVHLPVQHASDAVLQRMRRPYRFADVAWLFDRLRRRLPDAALGTDLIVGFPGEREADARVLADWLARSEVSYAHVFPYSPRPGTAAASFMPRVPGTAVRERVAAIRAIGASLHDRFRRSQLGRTRDGLTLADGSLVLTDNALKVKVPPGRRRNERIVVRVVAADPLQGEVVG